MTRAAVSASAPLLQARDLCLDLPGHARPPLTLHLDRGEVLTVEGPSGTGKTTLLRVLGRLAAPASGELHLRGEPARRVPAPVWRRQVCYLAQKPVMLEGSVRQNIEAGFGIGQAPRIPEALHARGKALLAELGLEPERLWSQDARTLSGGEASRVALVRALAVEPRVLLCDEPTAALDVENAATLRRVLANWVASGGALVLVSHEQAPCPGLEGRTLRLEPS